MTKILTAILFLFFQVFCTGQEYLLDAKNFTAQDGLANVHIYTTFKDTNGFLWISTKYGLNRYDGYEYQIFTKEGNGLFKNRNINRICEDKEGNLWLFYLRVDGDVYIETIDVFNPITKRAVPLAQFLKKPIPFVFKELTIAYTDVQNDSNDFFIYDKRGRVFTYRNQAFQKIIEVSDKEIKSLVKTKNGLLIAAENELISLDDVGKISQRDSLPFRIEQILVDDESVWLVSKEKRSGKYFKNTVIWQRKNGASDFQVFPFEDDDLLKNVLVPGFVHKDKNGLWYVNAYKKMGGKPSFKVYDPEGKEIYDLKGFFAEEIDLKIRKIYEASEYIWLSGSSGLVQLKISKNPFSLIHSKTGLSDTRRIVEEESGGIYFLNGEIYAYQPRENQLKQLSKERGAFHLIYQDSSLYASTHSTINSGIFLDLETKQEKFTDLWESYTPSIASIKWEKTGEHLLGNILGLSFFDFAIEQGRPFEQYNEFEELKDYSVYDFHRDENGIWLATENGVYLMNEERGIIRKFNRETGDLPINHIRYLTPTQEKSSFWLATSGGGIIKWQPNLTNNKPSDFLQLTSENGLSDNYTYAIYPDDYGSLWVTSDNGLMQIDEDDLSVKTYLTDDGLPHNEFNTSSHYRAKDGYFYFGGLGGLVRFYPKDFALQKDYDFPLELTKFQVWEDKKEVITDKTKELDSLQSITIHPSDKLFELKFALLDFDNPENHNYSYKIEGYDNRSNLIKENFLRIPNLPYGTYQLKIKGQNITKGWSMQEIDIPIYVLKPFYLQTWFIGGLILLGTTLVFGYFYRRERRLHKEQQRLETEVERRTATIKQQSEKLKELDKAKTRFFSNITHEFRTPLTLILGPSEQLAQNDNIPIVERKQLWNITKNAQQLLSLINQMLDISKLEGGQMPIEVSKGELISFVGGIVEQFRPLIQKQQQTLHFSSEKNVWETNFDKDKINKILFNLLSNACKFTPSQGEIFLTLKQTQIAGSEGILIEVEDTGIGMDEAQLQQIFDRFFQVDGTTTRRQEGTGIGLSLVKELVDLLDGKIKVSSQVGEGTCFSIVLPVLVENKSVSVTETKAQILPLPLDLSVETVTQTESATPSTTEKLELLVIEDNQGIHDYIETCIDTEKYNIIRACDGEEGIEKALQSIPDIIISDVMMPKKDGFTVLSEIRANIKTSHIPFILLTAKSSLESRLQGFQRGADAYLTKPFSSRELVLRIDKLIELRRILQTRFSVESPVQQDLNFEKEDIFIAKIKQYILDNIEETNINGNTIGKHFGFSRMHLYRKLKALSNLSVSEIVKDIRLKKAMELLADNQNDWNVTEVSYKTGFSSVSYFSRVFKERYGKNPSEV